MNIREFLSEELVVPVLDAASKEEALRKLARFLCEQHPNLLSTPEAVWEALNARERLGSTGVGEGVAIPHARIPGLDRLLSCFARIPGGVDFDAIDQQSVKLVFTLLVPESSAGTHLKALARISRLLKNASFRDRLLSLQGRAELYQAFVHEDGVT